MIDKLINMDDKKMNVIYRLWIFSSVLLILTGFGMFYFGGYTYYYLSIGKYDEIFVFMMSNVFRISHSLIMLMVNMFTFLLLSKCYSSRDVHIIFLILIYDIIFFIYLVSYNVYYNDILLSEISLKSIMIFLYFYCMIIWEGPRCGKLLLSQMLLFEIVIGIGIVSMYGVYGNYFLYVIHGLYMVGSTGVIMYSKVNMEELSAFCIEYIY